MSDLVKHSMNDLEKMAFAIAKSGLFGIKTIEQALALCLIAQAEGKHPALAALDYSIIHNRPSKNASAIQRDFLAAGGTIEWHRSDDEVCEATFFHPKGGSLPIKWDMERAKQAGLDQKENWVKYPAAMLRARTISEGCDAIFPSPAKLYPPEIIEDFSESKNLTCKPTLRIKPIEDESEIDPFESLKALLRVNLYKMSQLDNSKDLEGHLRDLMKNPEVKLEHIDRAHTESQIEKLELALARSEERLSILEEKDAEVND